MALPEIGVCDVGSTKAKVGNQVLNLRSRETEQGVEPPMAYFDTGQLDRLSQDLKRNIGMAPTIGFTGKQHTLVPVYRNGRTYAAKIGDEPSLTPIAGMPMRLQPYYPENKTAPESAARKLAALQEHPERLEDLFGFPVDPGDLYISTLLTFLAQNIVGQELPIFPGEAKDFRREELEREGKTVAGVFGMKEDRVVLGNHDVLEIGGGKKVYVLPDSQAEFRVLKKLGSLELIPSGAWVFATDGVLKRIREAPTDGVKTLEDWYYDTMRRMGNTGPKVIFPLAQARGLASSLADMFSLFEESLRETEIPRDWLYDPRADNQKGMIWHKEGNRWNAKDMNELMRLDNDNFWAAVRAYGWGMACAMYEGTPSQMTDAVIYGGLMCLFGGMQPGWGHVFTESAPENTMVHWLKMTDAGQALKLIIMENEGVRVNWGAEVPIESLRRGGGMLSRWLEMKEVIVAQGGYVWGDGRVEK